MADRERYIAGVPCWVDTSQPDPAAAAQFYSRLFGWEFVDVMEDNPDSEYFVARLRGGDVAAVASVAPGAPPIATWNTYIWVDSADGVAGKARAAGGNVGVEPFDVGDAGRMAILSDREGAVFCVWEPKQHRGAEIVNEPGSLNFNGLGTRNVAAAKEFYGAVFGWETISLGDAGAEMWTLTAYGDHLETGDPGLRQRMAEVGAPAGFENVVASMTTIPDDQPSTPAHWNVTFAVEDADAIAAQATELGGKVVIPPFNAPWVRMTIIEDPQGAVFIASKFVPENRDPTAQGADTTASAA